MERRFLVTTDHGDVLVRVPAGRSGLDPALLVLEVPTEENAGDLDTAVPLRAFGAKVLEIIETQGGDMPGGPALRRMMIQEKAAADLNRIERWARDHVAPSSES